MLGLTHSYWQILKELEQRIPEMQNSTKILVFSNCACVNPFQHKSEFGNILTLKTRNFFFAGVEYSSEAFQINWAFDEYTNLCKWEKINDVYFSRKREN